MNFLSVSKKTTKKQVALVVMYISIACLLAYLSFQLLYITGVVKKDQATVADWVSAVISSLALVSGVVAVLLAYDSIKLTQKAEEGNLYLNLMQRYSDGKMVEALRTLSDFRDTNQSDFNSAIIEWSKKRLTGDEEALKIEKARHMVKYFYRDLMQLVQADYFSRELAKRICNTGGRYIFKEVVLPMDQVINSYIFAGEFAPFDELFEELKTEQNKNGQ
ncbi:MAG TPA: hypothetical protein PLL23_04400 [Chitinophagaceae bacterium]|jgi:hypothetical protein|nr:hypothetical protein [Chitinophagaceae bacterium]